MADAPDETLAAIDLENLLIPPQQFPFDRLGFDLQQRILRAVLLVDSILVEACDPNKIENPKDSDDAKATSAAVNPEDGNEHGDQDDTESGCGSDHGDGDGNGEGSSESGEDEGSDGDDEDGEESVSSHTPAISAAQEALPIIGPTERSGGSSDASDSEEDDEESEDFDFEDALEDIAEGGSDIEELQNDETASDNSSPKHGLDRPPIYIEGNTTYFNTEILATCSDLFQRGMHILWGENVVKIDLEHNFTPAWGPFLLEDRMPSRLEATPVILSRIIKKLHFKEHECDICDCTGCGNMCPLVLKNIQKKVPSCNRFDVHFDRKGILQNGVSTQLQIFALLLEGRASLSHDDRMLDELQLTFGEINPNAFNYYRYWREFGIKVAQDAASVAQGLLTLIHLARNGSLQLFAKNVQVKNFPQGEIGYQVYQTLTLALSNVPDYTITDSLGLPLRPLHTPFGGELVPPHVTKPRTVYPMLELPKELQSKILGFALRGTRDSFTPFFTCRRNGGCTPTLDILLACKLWHHLGLRNIYQHMELMITKSRVQREPCLSHLLTWYRTPEIGFDENLRRDYLKRSQRLKTLSLRFERLAGPRDDTWGHISWLETYTAESQKTLRNILVDSLALSKDGLHGITPQDFEPECLVPETPSVGLAPQDASVLRSLIRFIITTCILPCTAPPNDTRLHRLVFQRGTSPSHPRTTWPRPRGTWTCTLPTRSTLPDAASTYYISIKKLGFEMDEGSCRRWRSVDMEWLLQNVWNEECGKYGTERCPRWEAEGETEWLGGVERWGPPCAPPIAAASGQLKNEALAGTLTEGMLDGL